MQGIKNELSGLFIHGNSYIDWIRIMHDDCSDLNSHHSLTYKIVIVDNETNKQ